MLRQLDRVLLAICGIGFAGVIFVIDIMSPLGVLVPALYLLLLPVLGVFDLRHGALLFSGGTLVLSVLGGLLSPPSDLSADVQLLEAVINRGMLTVAVLAASVSYLRHVALEQSYREQQILDPLTGLTVRHIFLMELADLARSAPDAGPVTILALRLQGRAALVSAHGARAAEAALVALANACRGGLPGTMLLGTYDTATVVAAAADLDRAAVEGLAERVRAHLEGQPLLVGGATAPVRVRPGIAMLPPGEAPRTAVDQAVAMAMRRIDDAPSVEA